MNERQNESTQPETHGETKAEEAKRYGDWYLISPDRGMKPLREWTKEDLRARVEWLESQRKARTR